MLPVDAPRPEAKETPCRRWRAADGLTLSALTWPPAPSSNPRLPVLCLSGLSRNARDFEALAADLCARGHRVLAMDYRGRGESDRDTDWRNYSVEREAEDIDAGLAALAPGRFIAIGTSRGGIHAMLLACRHPGRVAGIVLNDVGPELDRDGLARIAVSIGTNMRAEDWQAAADSLERSLKAQFPALDAAGWRRLAHQFYRETPNGLTLDYDPALRHNLVEAVQPDAPPIDLWPIYDQLGDVPLLILRGAHSDILTEATLAEMLRRHPNAEAMTIPDEGHAPLLWDAETLARIADFADRCT